MKFLFQIIIFYFIHTNCIIKTIIVLPLKKANPFKDLINPCEFIDYFQQNNLYSIIKIGDPPQNLEIIIKEEYYPFSISSLYCNLNEFYNKNISKAFINISKFEEYIYNIHDSCIAEETFYFYSDINLNRLEKFENIEFIYEREKQTRKGETEIYNNCGIIGFGLSKYNNEKNKYNLITQLKKLDFIFEYTWSIKFIENDKNDLEGYLIIGDYPHIYDMNNFNEINIRTVLNNMEEKNWNLEFKNITINNTSLTHYLTGIISLSTNLIIGTEEYKSKIGYMFFNKYTEKNICFDATVNSHYFLYYCKSSEFNQSDIINFPSLNFYHFEFNFTFTFNGSDLFLENNDYYYFLIIFDRYDYRNWNFGKVFLKKYQLFFNPDSKTISYYINNGNNEEKDIYYRTKNKKTLIIILIIIGIASFIVGLLIGSYIYGNKNKKKAKEMKEELFFENKESFEDSNNFAENATTDSIRIINS